MFIAREHGPELVGTIGNKNAVANNMQIIEGIEQGVRDAIDGLKIEMPSYDTAFGDISTSMNVESMTTAFRQAINDAITELLIPQMNASDNERNDILERIARKDTTINLDGRKVNEQLDDQRIRSGVAIRVS